MSIEERSGLEFDPGEAKWVWSEVARVLALHRELASLYRTRSSDRKTIRQLWELIDEGEFALRTVGVFL